MLSALRDTLAPGGLTVLAVALSSIGAAHLRKCGFRAAQTIQSALSRRKRGTAAWDCRTVIIADEAEHIDTKLMYRLFEAVQKSGARLILSGAKLQTGSIEAGEAIFAELVSQYDCPDQKTANQQPPKSRVALSKNLDADDIEKAIRAYHAARQIVAPITVSHDRLNAENGQPSHSGIVGQRHQHGHERAHPRLRTLRRRTVKPSSRYSRSVPLCLINTPPRPSRMCKRR